MVLEVLKLSCHNTILPYGTSAGKNVHRARLSHRACHRICLSNDTECYGAAGTNKSTRSNYNIWIVDWKRLKVYHCIKHSCSFISFNISVIWSIHTLKVHVKQLFHHIQKLNSKVLLNQTPLIVLKSSWVCHCIWLCIWSQKADTKHCHIISNNANVPQGKTTLINLKFL